MYAYLIYPLWGPLVGMGCAALLVSLCGPQAGKVCGHIVWTPLWGP